MQTSLRLAHGAEQLLPDEQEDHILFSELGWPAERSDLDGCGLR